MQFKSFMEALKGKQHKIDKNKNGKIDAHDFKLLQKEEQEKEESEDRMARADYKVSPSGRKSHKEIVFTSGQEDKTKETVKEEMTDAQMKKREEIVKSMKKDKAGFKDRYGDRAETVMYATATKMAMKEEVEEIDELDKSTLGSYIKKASKDIAKHTIATRDYGDKAGKSKKHSDFVDNAMASVKSTQKADKRQDNIAKAVNRLTKEEAEELDEKSDQAKQNKTMKNMMDASRGARFKLNNPVPDAEPEHKNARAHNVAIGRALRKEEKKENVPFDGPYTKAQGTTKDKSGAVHTPMSRAKHLAKMAMKKQMKEDIDRLFEKDDSEYNYEGEMAVTQLKTISRHAEALQAKMKPDTNLPEWVQSKITLATDYMQTAHDYLMSELDEQAPVAPVPGMKFKNHAVMVHPETKSRVVINRKNIDNYTSDGYKEVRPGQKLKEDEEVKFSYIELMMINEIKLADLPVRRIKGHSYGADYSDPEGADDYDDKKPMKPTAEKRGRGRPAGSQSGARKNFGSSKLHTK